MNKIKLRKSKRIFICFIGLDGSGKSTLAEEMIKILYDKDIQSHYIWGGYTLYILRPFVKLIRKVITRRHNPFDKYKSYHSSLRSLNRRKLLFKIYKDFLMFEYLVEIFVKIKIPLWFGKNIISDRYVFDTATSIASNYDLSFESQREFINDLLRLSPKPDIVFLVDVPEKVAMSRKEDIPSLEYLKNRLKYYRNLCEYYDIVTLDGTSEISSLTKLIDNSIEIC